MTTKFPSTHRDYPKNPNQIKIQPNLEQRGGIKFRRIRGGKIKYLLESTQAITQEHDIISKMQYLFY